jgi:hypothetical protein
MLVLPPGTVLNIAERIERAYGRHRPEASRRLADAPVWGVAAARLVALHQEEPDLPLDPELYVAVQVRRRPGADPWSDLARPAAAGRYRAHVRRIVRRLRRELREELRAAGRLWRDGRSVEAVAAERRADLSPLGRYLFACRHDRPDLALALRAAAAAQHASCPLYRQACRGLIAEGLYPVHALLPGAGDPTPGGHHAAFSLN